MTAFRLSPDAEVDFESIAAERPSAVGGVLAAIEAACQLVATHPGVGRARDELEPGVRSFPVGSYVLFYLAEGVPLGIARILHGSRGIPVAFHER